MFRYLSGAEPIDTQPTSGLKPIINFSSIAPHLLRLGFRDSRLCTMV